jgi:hypothetical protein
VMGKFRSSDRYPGGNHPCVHHAFRKGKFHSLSAGRGCPLFGSVGAQGWELWHPSISNLGRQRQPISAAGFPLAISRKRDKRLKDAYGWRTSIERLTVSVLPRMLLLDRRRPSYLLGRLRQAGLFFIRTPAPGLPSHVAIG